MAESPVPFSVTLELDCTHPLSPDLYGANTEALHLPVWFDQPGFAEKYQAIGRPFIRFPGGTPSNFYNPRTGFFDDDSPSDREHGDQNKKLHPITDGACRTPEPFFQFAKQHNVRYSLMLIYKYVREHTLEKTSLLSSGKAATAGFTTGVQLFHRADMPLKKAMQDTGRSERMELSRHQLEAVVLTPYSITRLEIDSK